MNHTTIVWIWAICVLAFLIHFVDFQTTNKASMLGVIAFLGVVFIPIIVFICFMFGVW